MINKYSTYCGLADIINSLHSDEDIKLFLVKYRKWYINEKKCTWYDAQYQIERDIKYMLSKFIKNDYVIEKFNKIIDGIA